MQPLHGERDRDADGKPVGDRRARRRVDGHPRLVAVGHHRHVRRHHAHANHGGRALCERRGDASRQGPVPDRDEHRRRRLRELVEDLVADRLIGLVLDRLRAVLEERQPLRLRPCPRGILGLVEIATGDPDVGAEPLEQPELDGGRARRQEHDSTHSDLAAGPRDRDAVIPGRGRDHARRAVAHEVLDHREGGTPLEHAELVEILPFQPEVLAPREGRQCCRRPLERRRQLHLALRLGHRPSVTWFGHGRDRGRARHARPPAGTTSRICLRATGHEVGSRRRTAAGASSGIFAGRRGGTGSCGRDARARLGVVR